MRAAADAGILSREEKLPETTSQEDLLAIVMRLSNDDTVDGVLVQMPLPGHIDRRAVIEAVDPAKDVDGFHPVNVGRLWTGQKGFVPCTPLGVIELLEREKIEIKGAEAVVVGRSEIVGKPMAALLMQRHATVTVCHSRTRGLPTVAARADILVAAIGRPAFVTQEFIKRGATVVDVGINRIKDEALVRDLFGEGSKRLESFRKRGSTLVGDVHPGHAAERAGAWTPVPGGVGPLTVALLLKNTLEASRVRQHGST
jgi:methylenetetrahydrofolate dehydrogenase (NADP+)/methenyltetrahydrofolate cyclohydrolase